MPHLLRLQRGHRPRLVRYVEVFGWRIERAKVADRETIRRWRAALRGQK
jgi:hypothetical protein